MKKNIGFGVYFVSFEEDTDLSPGRVCLYDMYVRVHISVPNLILSK